MEISRCWFELSLSVLIVFFHLDFDHHVSSLKLKTQTRGCLPPFTTRISTSKPSQKKLRKPHQKPRLKRQTENPSETNKSHDTTFSVSTFSVSSTSISLASISPVWQCIRTKKRGGMGNERASQQLDDKHSLKPDIIYLLQNRSTILHTFFSIRLSGHSRKRSLSFFWVHPLLRSAFRSFFDLHACSSFSIHFITLLKFTRLLVFAQLSWPPDGPYDL